jgi:hypothetical protein
MVLLAAQAIEILNRDKIGLALSIDNKKLCGPVLKLFMPALINKILLCRKKNYCEICFA